MRRLERFALALSFIIVVLPMITLNSYMMDHGAIRFLDDIIAFTLFYLLSFGPILLVLLVGLLAYHLFLKTTGPRFRALGLAMILVYAITQCALLATFPFMPDAVFFATERAFAGYTTRFRVIGALLATASWLTVASILAFLLLCGVALVARWRRRRAAP